MMENKGMLLPSPIIDAKEDRSLKQLTERYDKLMQPGKMSKLEDKAAALIPQRVKQVGKAATNEISEKRPQNWLLQKTPSLSGLMKHRKELKSILSMPFAWQEDTISQKLSAVIKHRTECWPW